MTNEHKFAKGISPKVSVIVPFFNVENYLEECLDSLSKQTLKDIEIICVNDGSTDNSAATARMFCNNDKRITLIEKSHTNIGDASNAGLKAARGEYIAFVNGDDFVERDWLEKICEIAAEHSADIVHFRSDIYDINTREFTESPWTLRDSEMPDYRPFSAEEASEKIFNMGSCTPHDKLFRRSFIKDNKLYFQSISTSNDMLFTFGALALAESITTADYIFYHSRVGHEETTPVFAEDITSNYYKALMALKSFLENRGIYEAYKKSFLNWAVDFSLWNLHQFSEPLFHDLILQQLKRKYFEDLEIYELPEEDYYNRDLYAEVAQLKKELVVEKASSVSCRPKVSVIVPVYNAESNIEACLERIIFQTLTDIEIICIDDGSTDKSFKLLKKMAAEDDRITVIKNRITKGHGAALNQGIEEAKGEYLCFAEPFDLISITMLEKLYFSAIEKDLEIVKGDICKLKHDAYNNVLTDYKKVALSESNYNRVIDSAYDRIWRDFINVVWGGIYKKDFIKKNNLLFNDKEDAPFIDDKFVFNTNINARRIMYIPYVCYYDTMKSYLFSGYPMTELL